MGIRVKQLEWEWPCKYGLICRAITPIGIYSISPDEDSTGGAIFLHLHLTEDGDCTKCAVEILHDYVEPGAAQAAAQADFERRILSAIEEDRDEVLEQAAKVILADDIAISRMAEAMHDGPLGADEYWFSAGRKAGAWCIEMARAGLNALVTRNERG